MGNFSGMSKPPKFKYKNTAAGWKVECPATLTASGKRERHFFKTRDLAAAHAQELRAQFLDHGSNAAAITPAMAEDATLAADLLKPWNVSLLEAARAYNAASEALSPFSVSLTQAAAFYVQHHDKKTQAPSLAEAWDTALKHRENHRPRTIADFRAWKKALPAWLMAMNCYEITGKEITKALDETTKGASRWKSGMRVISSVLGDVVKSGAIAENPVKGIQVKRNPEKANDEVVIYSPAELKALFAACIDYPLKDDKGEIEPDRLCAGCAVPFAFMAFAGIRPDEITKLKWEDVSLELHNIRIGATIAKKLYRRNVRINATLAAWISTIPAEQRVGKIRPARWTYKAAKVRIKAGIDGREKQDALRHSYASYMLATEGDLDALKQDMGHGHMAVFFNHYHKALTKAEALPYWQILPPGAKLPKLQLVEGAA
jgi:integrase